MDWHGFCIDLTKFWSNTGFNNGSIHFFQECISCIRGTQVVVNTVARNSFTFCVLDQSVRDSYVTPAELLETAISLIMIHCD